MCRLLRRHKNINRIIVKHCDNIPLKAKNNTKTIYNFLNKRDNLRNYKHVFIYLFFNAKHQTNIRSGGNIFSINKN